MKQTCGAKTRTGAPCKAPVVKGMKRCKRHGGKSTGPIVPNSVQNATKHGIYGRHVRPEEKETFDAIQTARGTLDNEIDILRLQYDRVLAAQERASEARDGLELVKRHDREASEYGPGDEAVYERVDYNAHLVRLASAIEKLETKRAELIKAEREANPPGDKGPVTEYEVHVVTAENVHLYQDAGSEDE